MTSVPNLPPGDTPDSPPPRPRAPLAASKPRIPSCPHITARYENHPIARYNANALIKALRRLPDSDDLGPLLTRTPQGYDESQRNDDRSVRIGHLMGLNDFFLGLPHVVELAESLHAMICEGYAGREPHSLEEAALRQIQYERQQRRSLYDDGEDDLSKEGSSLSSALIGAPGIGKSEALKRVAHPYRVVIYHPDLEIYQIPVLLIEMPYDGMSINVLSHAIIREIDKMFPQGDYFRLYLKGKENAEVRFLDAVQLMQTHFVGALLIDEAQNRPYSADPMAPRRASTPVRGQAPLTTLLITSTNRAQVPMLMSGTPELRDELGSRMSMVRRMVGRGMRVWGPLALSTKDDLGEFDIVLQVLWNFQWTKTPFELSPHIRNLFWYHSQGITDVIVKLFHESQLRAIRNGGDEIVDVQLIHDVATKELGALTELTAAMRDKKKWRVNQVPDLAALMRVMDQQDHMNTPLFSANEPGPEAPVESVDLDMVISAGATESTLPAQALADPSKQTPTKKRSGKKRPAATADGADQVSAAADGGASDTPKLPLPSFDAVKHFNSSLDE
jgi:hypothetical protein